MLFYQSSGERALSKHHAETGNRGVSRSHHRRPIGLPLNPGECGLAYSSEWHRRPALAPFLGDDEDQATTAALRAAVVAPAQPSAKARRQVSRQRTDEGAPVQSLQT